MNKIKNKKVLVAMSGGVDSSMAAALLKRAGFNLTGVFMKLNNFSKDSEKRARKVAKILKIPFYVFDFRKEFKKRVIDYFLDEYKKSKTPNPCVVCNKEIKFGLLMEKALALDADFVATGHYARKQKIENRKQKIEYKLMKAKDKEKDQSYFLWKLNQKQLSRILFPVGNYTRREVEILARKFKLPVLSAKKSVEICFISKTIEDFLKKHLKEKPGRIIDKKGKVLGEHQGLWFYTIGQRKGIKLPSGPYYVIDKNFRKNILVVSKNEKDLVKKELTARNVNWILGEEPRFPLKINAKIRYRHESVLAIITKNLKPTPKRNQRFLTGQGIYKLKFTKLQRAITLGQSVVFYWGDELLGGGIIER
jgi:tRNA-specific 2-thiouridylase